MILAPFYVRDTVENMMHVKCNKANMTPSKSKNILIILRLVKNNGVTNGVKIDVSMTMLIERSYGNIIWDVSKIL